MNVKNRKMIAAIALTFAAGILMIRADTHYVRAPETCTNTVLQSPYTNWADAATNIQWAVNAASAATFDTVLVSNGTYNLTNQIEITNNITVQGLNGTNFTFINGNYPNYTNRCVFMNAGTLDGFTISNGFLTNSTTNYPNSGYPYALGGAGIGIRGGATVKNCYIYKNFITNHGGGGIHVCQAAGVTISNCAVVSNTCTSGSSGYGGGIYLDYANDPGLLIDSYISGNIGGMGGGVANLNGAGRITNCTVANNRALQRAGGVYLLNVGGVALANCVISNNSAPKTGAMYIYGSKVINSFIIGNRENGLMVDGVIVTHGGIMSNCHWTANPFVEVIEVVPNKILYNDNEAGKAKVRLANPFEREVEVTLKPTMLWDLEESLALKPVTVKVPAKGNAEAEVSWPAVRERWGHEIMVEAVVDGKTVDRGRQFFGVNSDWMDMILISFPRRHDNLLINIDPFSHYTTVNHWFAWAPGDFVQNAPEYDEWYSGHTGYHMRKEDIRKSIRELHEKGIRCTFFNIGFSSGKAGLEWARQHPEWVCRKRDGSPLLVGSALAMTNSYADKSTSKMGYVGIDFYDEKVIEWGAKNAIESIKMFGWDGMFWDCGGPALFPGFSYDGQPTPHGQEPDKLSARNYRMFHEIVRKEFPHFGIWINGETRLWKQSFWSRFGNCGGFPTVEEQFSTPQTGLLVESRQHGSPGTRFSNWQRCHDIYVQERDTVTQQWGAPIIAGYTTPWNWRAESHLAALLLACQMRSANCCQEGSWPMTQFMTRYSSMLWRRDIKVIAEPEKMLAVETTRPVWWKRFVYRRPVKGGEDILMHMVSIPETENVDITQKDNPVATTGKVMLMVPAGRKVRKVYALQPRLYRPGVDNQAGIGLDVGGRPARVVEEPDPKDPAKKVWVHRTGSLCRGGPSQVELKTVSAGGKVTVEVPEFVYHTLIVFRLEE